MTAGRVSVPGGRLPDMQQTHRADFTDPRLRLAYAVLYVAGIGLMVTGSVGAFLWAPLLWCAAVGFGLIALSFAVRAGRF